MTSKTQSTWNPITLAGTLLALLLLPLGVAAQQPAAGGASEGAAAPAGDHAGIKVHGRWVLEVRDPDGTVVERREFENALLGSGGSALAGILGGTETPGNWIVGFGNGNGFGTASGPCASSTSCHIIAQGSAFNWDFSDTASTNLDVSVATGAGTVTLTGSHTVAGGDIGWVGTAIGTCGISTTPEACDSVRAYTFTRKNLSSPVSTTSGQVVSVTVTLSFS